uniref:Contactin-associated protein 2-like n=1 Tax=Hydra vulgaris TaxID=6087 RepID=A0A0H5FN87_HYDVU|nr:Contactin-associated protein 2-like [Hydra vulgaris]
MNMRNLFMVICCFFLNNFFLINADESTASFTGNDYIRYEITNKQETRKDKVTMRFKTTEAFGVLIYSCGIQGDFLLLELQRGKLVYTGNFGSTLEEYGAHKIIHEKQYNDNSWHDVVILRENGTHVYFTVDDKTKSYISHLDFEQLNLDYLYVGGLGLAQKDETTCLNIKEKINFIGCMSKVRFNSIDLLYGAIEKFTHFKTFGHLSFTCPDSKLNIFGFSSVNSQMTLRRNILNVNELNFALELRTFEPNGQIATHLCTNGAIEIILVNGKLNLIVSFIGLSAHNAVTIKSEIKVDDGNWHVIRISVQRNEDIVKLQVDHVSEIHQFKSYFRLGSTDGIGNFMGEITIGGSTPELPCLLACYRTIEVDNEPVLFDSSKIIKKREVGKNCNISDLCFPNPCLHKGVCFQSLQTYTCNCTNSDYSGTNCETCVYKRTCHELMDSGFTESKNYKLCSNNEQVYQAYCDMSSGETIIGHNIKNDTRVDEGEKVEGTQSFYIHPVKYSVDVLSIINLMELSSLCKQYIRFDCFQSKLLDGVGRKRYDDYKGARWLSRDSERQHFWGNSNPDRRTCSCGMDKSCAKGDDGKPYDCNCDAGDAKWRFDDGYLTQKSLLPVTEVQFSIGKSMNVKSYFTVGELKCSGTKVKPSDIPVTTMTTTVKFEKPKIINNSMFSIRKFDNVTILTLPASSSSVRDSIDTLFSKPWLITIVCIGVLLCLLLVVLVFILFRQNLGSLLIKCVYGKHVNKPKIEIEDYNRYSTVTENQSDWDIHHLSTTFPTSTPAPSYGPTDDEESTVDIRCRTVDDLRVKRSLKKLTNWGSRTASAPTVMGSVNSLQYKNDNVQAPTHNEVISKPNCKNIFGSSDTAFSTTATDGEAESIIDSSASEYSQKSSSNSVKSSLKESEHESPLGNKKLTDVNILNKNENNEKLQKSNDKFYCIPAPMPTMYSEPMKNLIPITPLPLNGYRNLKTVRCGLPYEFGGHLAIINNNSNRCQLKNASLTRIIPVRRVSVASENYKPYPHPTIQERCEETTDSEHDTLHYFYDNLCNSDGFYDNNDGDQGFSPSSETRPLFDEINSRDEQEREADEQIKLLKRKVIEKATSFDEGY